MRPANQQLSSPLGRRVIDLHDRLPDLRARGWHAHGIVAVPVDDPARFNATVDRFLSRPFVATDRVGGLVKSGARLHAEFDAEMKALKGGAKK